MIDYENPFEYEAANRLSTIKILDFYIEDYNYSRFIRSRRNIFLVGERGTGKTMTLLYNSLPVQRQESMKKDKPFNLDLISVYIPCNTPLTHKKEYELLGDFKAAVVSEHFLTLSIMYSIVDTIGNIADLLGTELQDNFKKDIEYILNIQLPERGNTVEGLKLYIQKELLSTQQTINGRSPDAFYDNAFSFSSGVVPLVLCLKKIKALENSHFSLMFDDAHDLNKPQIQSMNSWIAYRDNSNFSFKVATTKVGRPSFHTASGGQILEGHDFTQIDMEQPYQNQYSDFGKFTRQIITRRLEKIGIKKTAEEFFPINREFEKDIEECREVVEKGAIKKFGNSKTKSITDYVYKYTRAEYFRRRSEKANRPPYSGLETLIHLSTGVVRNLLEPCYWMYDAVVSEKREAGESIQAIEEIPPAIQTRIILSRSKEKWEWLRKGLDNTIEGCSKEQAQQIFQLFDNLAIHFRERLLHHSSEPRAITFTISEINDDSYRKLLELLEIARKAQILYTYTSSGKDSGKREIYYVPNRMLWPDRGLDPQGQHARVSIKTTYLWAAATLNKKIPVTKSDFLDDQQEALEFSHE